jgi:Ca-activated chloride channel family protein
MEGNFFNSRGLYTEAIASYLKARDYAESEPYAEYGLGSVYFALNEGAAALERFDSAEKAIRALNREDHGELIYRLRYNKGIIYFEEEKFKDAWEAFRNALETDGSRIEAKRNLELSLLAMEQERGVPPPVLRAGRGENETGTETLFDYLRRKEREQWENKNWPGESFPSGPDY